MDLWQLKIFCKVVELKSFSRAGEAVRLSQPAVSNHIKELENFFGTQLVDRLSKQAVPTKAGELLYRYARRMLALHDETRAAMDEFLGSIKGRLCVGGSTIPGVYLLPRLIGRFTQKYPDVRISLVISDSSAITARILSGEIELGIVGARTPDRQLSQTLLLTDSSYLVVPAGHKWAGRKQVNIREVMDEPFIIRESGSGTLRAFEQSLHRIGRSLKEFHIVAEMGSTEAVRQAIINRVGVSILPAIAVTHDAAAGELRALTISGIDLKRSFFLTSHSNRTPSPLSRRFNAFIQSHFKPGDDRQDALCI